MRRGRVDPARARVTVAEWAKEWLEGQSHLKPSSWERYAGILREHVLPEWGEHRITVNAVAPTFIETPGTASALSDPAFHADTLERIAALHRIGQPHEVSGAVVFLASPAASMITGHTLVIDGGWMLR